MVRRYATLIPVALIAVVAVIAVAVIAVWALSRHRAIEAVAPPERSAFPADRIARGARLAAIGNCTSCHTQRDGRPFAGGVPLVSQFGTIHGTNITPDPETGIGTWSEAAFVRSMREGVARDGTLLYPAFPYDHFTRASDDDLQALYAYVMTRDAVRATAPANDLVFPLGWRPLLAGWNLLFLDPGPKAGDRGTTLVDGLGHCGACHTPRNAMGAEQRDARWAGARIEGWYAPPLDADSPSPIPWTHERLVAYLRTGIADEHALAGGPMQSVTTQLAEADPADVDAIATAVLAAMGPPDAKREARAAASRERAARPLSATALPKGADDRLRVGASVYAEACASCHDRGRQASSQSALQMPLAVANYDDDPRSLLRIVREGILPGDAERRRWMPAFGASLSDPQLVALATYLRRVAADRPAWTDLESAVEETHR